MLNYYSMPVSKYDYNDCGLFLFAAAAVKPAVTSKTKENNAAHSVTKKRSAFNLQASLKKNLNYKPYTGEKSSSHTFFFLIEYINVFYVNIYLHTFSSRQGSCNSHQEINLQPFPFA